MYDEYVYIYVITPRKIILILPNIYNSKERHSSSKIAVKRDIKAAKDGKYLHF